jgi:hypothetical protein
MRALVPGLLRDGLLPGPDVGEDRSRSAQRRETLATSGDKNVLCPLVVEGGEK